MYDFDLKYLCIRREMQKVSVHVSKDETKWTESPKGTPGKEGQRTVGRSRGRRISGLGSRSYGMLFSSVCAPLL